MEYGGFPVNRVGVHGLPLPDLIMFQKSNHPLEIQRSEQAQQHSWSQISRNIHS